MDNATPDDKQYGDMREPTTFLDAVQRERILAEERQELQELEDHDNKERRKHNSRLSASALRALTLVWAYLSLFFIAGYRVGVFITVEEDGVVAGLIFLFIGLALGLVSWMRHDFDRIRKELW